MKVDHVLILAAGKGTRMGEIGKVLPKVIWPIFDKSLLELQVAYAKSLAPTAKIHINIFNYKECLLSFIAKNERAFIDVDFVIEEEVLDIGGAVHNLAQSLSYDGNLLILNSDQFLFCDRRTIDTGLDLLKKMDSLLFTYQVNSDAGYNALDIKDGFLTKIISNENLTANTNVQTYTGMSLVKLSSLGPKIGELKFFDSVANPQKIRVGVKEMLDFEYWDFGTKKRYLTSINKIFSEPNSDFYKFLLINEAIDENLIDGNSYNSNEGKRFGELEITESTLRYRSIVDQF